MKAIRLSKGFTLIEIMVVVTIIAIIAGFSFLALSQAGDRRYLSQADQLLAWFQQLSELALLEGSAYGLVQDEQTLMSVVFYQGRWHRAALPEPFQLYQNARLTLPENEGFSLVTTLAGDQKKPFLPAIVMLPDGFMEPAVVIDLRFTGQVPVFSYSWDNQQASLLMERSVR
ncbi:type II secretion system GspH family protein [Gammaproteobacteria bacterium]|nr:type II secretion system GspH family protein [Gammaproteobacteria bacterium]